MCLFAVEDNEILSVIGPNGAGKSTLFKMISSFLPVTSGEVLYRGERISNLKPHIVARKGVVRTFQETTIFKSMTVRERCHCCSAPEIEGHIGGLLLGISSGAR
jgi:branched-chain amino acid transport system ATP-binding protein